MKKMSSYEIYYILLWYVDPKKGHLNKLLIKKIYGASIDVWVNHALCALPGLSSIQSCDSSISVECCFKRDRNIFFFKNGIWKIKSFLVTKFHSLISLHSCMTCFLSVRLVTPVSENNYCEKKIVCVFKKFLE